ncbi:mCG147048 [Mus musculus]|nr:mCG147048 [Mus musculus]
MQICLTLSLLYKLCGGFNFPSKCQCTYSLYINLAVLQVPSFLNSCWFLGFLKPKRTLLFLVI